MNRIVLGLVLLTALSACGGDAESREDLEGQPTSGPSPQDQPVRAAQPAPVVPPPPAEVRAIPAGTVLTFEVLESVSTSSHSTGDTFSLELVDAVSGTAGAFLPRGTTARGVVTDAHRSSGPDGVALLGVQVASVGVGGGQTSIDGQVQSTAIETSARDSGARTAATIATGAAAGAIIGQILGRDTRSTVGGAAVGTAVGVGVALTTRDGDATLPEGSRIVMRLDRELLF